jgi:hypothetical protein
MSTIQVDEERRDGLVERRFGAGTGELLVFCAECWQRESGVSTLADCR